MGVVWKKIEGHFPLFLMGVNVLILNPRNVHDKKINPDI